MFQPRTSWRYRLKYRQPLSWQTILLLAAAAFVVIYPVYSLVDAAITHGIHRAQGGLLVVDMKAMSDFELDQIAGTDEQIPRPYRDLNGKRVMLAGEIWAPDSAAANLDRFSLCYSINNCCFAGPPRVQHFIKATVLPGRDVQYRPGVVSVTGTLHVGVERSDGAVASVYRMDVEKVEP